MKPFRRILAVCIVTILPGAVLLLAQAPRGGQSQTDPPNPVFWSRQQIRDTASTLKERVNPDTHNAATALIPSANLIYREGDSGSEIHEKVADIIFVHEGEGVILIGGKMVGGKQERPDELRGTSIDGGMRYPIAAGDSIYIPANMAHQFFVEKGKHFVITIVKVPSAR